MSTSLPSLMTSKRKSPGKRAFDAANILADFTPATDTPSSFYRQTFLGKQVERNMLPAGRLNKLNLTSVCFLYENPRFVNEPICYANTKATDRSQSDWWPESVVQDTKITASYNTSSVSRSDYRCLLDKPIRTSRFGCTPHKQDVAKGIVPFDKTEKPKLERISFYHEFDCRKGRKERGKLHGSFV